MTVVLLGATVYISTLLLSPKSPTQIQKTKAADITYTRKVDLFPTGVTEDQPPTIAPTISKAATALPTKIPTILAQAPTVVPTVLPTIIPTSIPVATIPVATPTLQPLLAYKSTAISPTSVSVIDPTTTLSPTKKVQPTGVQQLPETGWIQTSSILFIVATSTILFSLLF